MSETIPIALFAYNRPDLLAQTLETLRINEAPLIYAFSDGPRSVVDAPAVEAVRATVRAVNWCEVRLTERDKNLGLGRSIRAGVTDVLQRHNTVLVFEDDLICAPGTYAYLCAALHHYHNAPAVMSVTGWTHPDAVPRDVAGQPYFDGRADCWVWGTWARAWRGMETQDAVSLLRQCRARGIDIYAYGADLPDLAYQEMRRNTWAIRWVYWHIVQGGLCLRPPHSLVEHIGFDRRATNAKTAIGMAKTPLQPCPPVPQMWPAPLEHPACAGLWRELYGQRPAWWRRAMRGLRRAGAQLWQAVGR
jgi:hypothetical protein